MDETLCTLGPIPRCANEAAVLLLEAGVTAERYSWTAARSGSSRSETYERVEGARAGPCGRPRLEADEPRGCQVETGRAVS